MTLVFEIQTGQLLIDQYSQIFHTQPPEVQSRAGQREEVRPQGVLTLNHISL